MSELLVYTYNTEDRAAEVLKEIMSMTQEHVKKPLIGIEDAAVVVKNAKGKVKIRQTMESAVKGGRVVSGGFWGMLIGFLFGGPLFGTLLVVVLLNYIDPLDILGYVAREDRPLRTPLAPPRPHEAQVEESSYKQKRHHQQRLPG